MSAKFLLATNAYVVTEGANLFICSYISEIIRTFLSVSVLNSQNGTEVKMAIGTGWNCIQNKDILVFGVVIHNFSPNMT